MYYGFKWTPSFPTTIDLLLQALLLLQNFPRIPSCSSSVLTSFVTEVATSKAWKPDSVVALLPSDTESFSLLQQGLLLLQALNNQGVAVTLTVVHSELSQALEYGKNVRTLVILLSDFPRLRSLFAKNSQHWWLVPESTAKREKDSLGLRLDSRLFSYSLQNDKRVALLEHYAIKGGPVIEQRVGLWTLDQGLVIFEPFIWRRRSDLHRVTLSNVVLSWPPIIDQDSSTGEWVGMFSDVVKFLERTLNFKVS